MNIIIKARTEEIARLAYKNFSSLDKMYRVIHAGVGPIADCDIALSRSNLSAIIYFDSEEEVRKFMRGLIEDATIGLRNIFEKHLKENA